MTKSKFDCYSDTFDVKKSNPLPNETDQVLPVPSDVEQNSRFVLSRSRGLRDDVSSRVCEHNEPVVPSVPVPTPVPAQDYDPSPEEDAHIKQLQRKLDENQVVCPKELGKNLSLPPVKHNKAKKKKPTEKVKKQPAKKNNNNEAEYSPYQKYSISKHEILPKNLRTRKVP